MGSVLPGRRHRPMRLVTLNFGTLQHHRNGWMIGPETPAFAKGPSPCGRLDRRKPNGAAGNRPIHHVVHTKQLSRFRQPMITTSVRPLQSEGGSDTTSFNSNTFEPLPHLPVDYPVPVELLLKCFVALGTIDADIKATAPSAG